MEGVSKLNENTSILTFDFTETLKSHLYLIQDRNEAALIDAHVGSMAEKVLKKIQEIIPINELKTVILTHGHMDHMGSSSLLKEKTKASIAIHIADAQYIEEPWTQFLTLFNDLGITKQAYEEFQTMSGGKPVEVTKPLHGGDIIKVGSIELHVIHTPGHSPGSICIYEPESKMMFTGDALIPSEWYPNTIAVFQDATKYIQSLTRLSEMEINTLCPGHGKIRQGSEVEKEFKVHFDRYYKIEAKIPEILSHSTGMTLWEIHTELANHILQPGDHAPGIGGLVSVKGFLNKLSFEGKIIQEKGSTWKNP